MPEFAQLIEGYQRFHASRYIEQKARFDALAHDGQAPPIMLISCCDSRVDPATIFDTVPGQIFALRNVANLVPPYEVGGGQHGASAAIEFGVVGLNVRHIVVLGHGQCGGIKAALANSERDTHENSFIDNWMSLIDAARDKIIGTNCKDPQRALEMEAVRVSLANLRTFPFVAAREAAGEIKLHGAWFAIDEGQLHVLDEAENIFAPV